MNKIVPADGWVWRKRGPLSMSDVAEVLISIRAEPPPVDEMKNP